MEAISSLADAFCWITVSNCTSARTDLLCPRVCSLDAAVISCTRSAVS
jgi:hypothetical protein